MVEVDTSKMFSRMKVCCICSTITRNVNAYATNSILITVWLSRTYVQVVSLMYLFVYLFIVSV